MQLIDPDGQVTLSAGPLTAVLRPSTGGSVARLDYDDGERSVALLRSAPPTTGHVLEMGNFPLVPYVNRIRGGQFTFRGQTVRLALNLEGDASPLHGQGWINPWQVVASAPRKATLSYEHVAGEWPWSYRAEQRFELNETSLEIVLGCRNLSPDPMPCGLGHHPYFRCSAGTRIRTDVAEVWTIDEQVLPVERIPATGRFDLANRAVCGLGLDHGFGGWGGSATLSDPDWPFEIRMSSPSADFFQLYSPESGGIFVAEPVTHANAALNAPEDQWANLGMRILQSEEEMTLTMRLEITPIE